MANEKMQEMKWRVENVLKEFEVLHNLLLQSTKQIRLNDAKLCFGWLKADDDED